MTPATNASPRLTSVVAALYQRTKELHAHAERSGIIRDILRGDASREGYALLLRNLHPAYQALEQGLEANRTAPGLDIIAAYRFDRAVAIAADLAALIGPDWATALPLLDEGTAYAEHISRAARDGGLRLIAHAYTRYLGDLSGGLIMKRLLAKSLDLQPDQLRFYDFSGFADPDTLKNEYRMALDRAGHATIDPHVVEEGATAFRLNIALSCAVRAAVSPDATASAAE